MPGVGVAGSAWAETGLAYASFAGRFELDLIAAQELPRMLLVHLASRAGVCPEGLHAPLAV